MTAFTATVRLAFAQRRKMLRNSLAAKWGRMAAAGAIEAIGLDPKCRAEELSLAEFLSLHEVLPRIPRDVSSARG